MSNYVQKIGLAAGSVSLAAVPVAANAALTHVTGSPLSVSFMDLPASVGAGFINVPWDVDGQDGADFSLIANMIYGTEVTTASGGKLDVRYGYNFIFAGSFTAGGALGSPHNGLAIGVTDSPGGPPVLAPLANSFVVGPTAGPYSSSGGIGNAGNVVRYISASGALTNQTSSPFPGISNGTINIGFLFSSSAGDHAGWASVTVDNGPEWKLTINEWVYESTPETPVHVPDVPVPATIVPALTLLGLGAAGLRRMRKREAVAAD